LSSRNQIIGPVGLSGLTSVGYYRSIGFKEADNSQERQLPAAYVNMRRFYGMPLFRTLQVLFDLSDFLSGGVGGVFGAFDDFCFSYPIDAV
jgi:hypothetical protein